MHLFSHLTNIVLSCVISETKKKRYHFPLTEFKNHMNLIEPVIISTVSGPTCSSHILLSMPTLMTNTYIYTASTNSDKKKPNV